MQIIATTLHHLIYNDVGESASLPVWNNGTDMDSSTLLEGA